jgi:hypothetical protein
MSLNEKCNNDIDIVDRFIDIISPPSLFGIMLFGLTSLGLTYFIVWMVMHITQYIDGT